MIAGYWDGALELLVPPKFASGSASTISKLLDKLAVPSGDASPSPASESSESPYKEVGRGWSVGVGPARLEMAQNGNPWVGRSDTQILHFLLRAA